MKHIFRNILTAILYLFSFAIVAQTTLVNYGSTWSYYDLQNEPAVQGSIDWNDLTYNATTWSSGPGQLGYGDGDESTLINSNTLTAYFRHAFNVSSPGDYDSLNLNLLFDDGAVVYLNGVEVWRQNMPGGAVSYGTFSSAVGAENGTASTIIANSLITGNNVIAIEVHQSGASSSDISFDFELIANAPGAVTVNRGPYLQKGTPTSMVIRWRTATPTESVVNYGTSLGSLNQNSSNLTPKTEHEIELTGLASNTKYFYRISNATTVLVPEASDVYFKTHPTVGSSQPFTFWALGDAGTATNEQRAVRDAYYNYIGSNVTDGILFLGDNAYNDGTDLEYQSALFNIYDQSLKNSVAWSTLGNHDGYTADSNSQTGPYYDLFTFPKNAESGGVASGTEAYYSFDYGNIHFIVLESYETDRSVGGTMYNWALSDITNTTQEWIVAIWHHPPYTKGSHNSDTEIELVQMRQNFLPMLETNGVDLVLSGHSHSYERSYFLNGHYGTSDTFDSGTMTIGASGDGDGKLDGNGAYVKGTSSPEGAVYITAGSSGKISGGSLNHNAMYASLNQLGSCILEVNGSTLNLKFITNTGTITDYFTIQKGCTQGASCDDGDPCTINDVYDANCGCVGTPDTNDSDGDGICDTVDQEANSPCPLDVDGNGVSNDTDGDGVANCLDAEPNSPCPINVDANGVSLDSDGDGVCDDDDICPGGNDNVDADNDGIPDFCDSSICLPDTTTFIPNGTLTHSGSGSSNRSATIPTDGKDVSFTISGLNQLTGGKPSGRYIEQVTVTYNNGSGNQTYGTFTESNGSTISVSITGIVQSVTVSLTDGYDGNSPTPLSVSLSTISFCVETEHCIDSDADGVCDLDDQCPGFDDNVDIDGDGIPNGCDLCNDLIDSDGDGFSDCVDQEINSPCPTTVDANGVSLDTDTDGVCDGLDLCPGFDDNLDEDNDGIPNGCDSCNNNLEGTICNDGNACTENDVYDANCNCIGTITLDTDGDGVCDAEDLEINSPCPNTVDSNGISLDSDNDGICDEFDLCPGQDDALIGTICNDGNACTINDTYDTNCGCVGTPVADNDGDGYCGVEDPNDNDPCIPDANSPTCNNCVPASGSFSNTTLTHSGSGSSTRFLNLPANSEDVSFTVSNIDAVQSGKPDFRYIDRVVVSYVDGNNTTQSYATFLGANSSTGVVNISGVVKSITVSLNDAYDGNAGVTMSVNLSQVSYCTIVGIQARSSRSTYNVKNSYGNTIEVYPNPASREVFIESSASKGSITNISLYNVAGQVIISKELGQNYDTLQRVNLEHLSDGLYLILVKDSNGAIIKSQRLVIKNN